MRPRSSVPLRLLSFATLLTSVAVAQSPATPAPSSIFGRLPPDEVARYHSAAVRLWEGRAPQAQGDAAPDIPLLYPVLPVASATPRPVLIVLPGGGYNYHSAAEAFPIAAHFRDRGFATFVLQYRLRPYGPAVSLLDAQRAVRQLRARRAEFHLDPAHIAMIGFSAGGHLAANVSTHGDDGSPAALDPVDRQSCRLQSTLLVYPSILHARLDRTTPAGRDWSNLLALDGLHRLVDPRTPPTFLLVGYDDSRAPYENCLVYAARLHEAGVRFELHVLGAGEHGVTVREDRRDLWHPLADAWLQTCGFSPTPVR